MAINKFVSTRNDKRSRLIPFSGGLDDGSTLNLDFTRMGTGADLSARGITFSRSSPATFINSSGYVDFPEINLFRNSSWSDSNPTPTSWTGAGNAPTIPSSGQRTFTVTTAATSYIAEAGTAATLTNGLQYTASVDIVDVAGAVTFSNLITATASPTNTKWYLIVGGAPPVEYLGTDIISSEGRVVFTFTSGTSSFIRVGLGASGVNQTNQSVTLKNPMLTPGIKINTNYVPSASSTAPYYGPRFDYNPTTLAARGLLIEGSTTNRAISSERFSTTNWGISGLSGGATTSTTQSNPQNTDFCMQFVEDTTTGGHGAYQIISGLTVGTIYTLSAWVKSDGTRNFASLRMTVAGGSPSFTAVWSLVNGAAGNTLTTGSPTSTSTNIVAYPNGWYRLQMSMACPAGFTAMLGYVNGSDTNTITNQPQAYTGTASKGIYVWGVQFEEGSGASSYIPTGPSTVQRAAESCSIAASSSWLNTASGTFVANWHRGDRGGTERSVLSSDYLAGRLLQLNNTDVSTSVSLIWWNGNIFRTTGTAINKAAYTYGQTTGSGATLQLPVRLCANGSAVATGTFGNGTSNGADVPNPVNWTNFVIGAASSGSPYITATRDWLNNCIRSIKYWPTVLPDATLQSLTQ